jgi:hypothetical protein
VTAKDSQQPLGDTALRGPRRDFVGKIMQPWPNRANHQDVSKLAKHEAH